jgi:acyl-homoserine-lactone acylase
VVVGLVVIAGCSPGEGPQSIPLPTSADTTTTTTTVPESTTTTTTVADSTTTTSVVPPTYQATIRRTTDGVPHITGDDLPSVAYGQGWASAEDHGCSLLDQILKVYGVRSANLGPGVDGANIESDFAWRAIGIATIATADFDAAPTELVEQFAAFAAGWNGYLTSTGSGGLTGWCGQADWVRPIQPVEVYVYARSLALLASGAQMVPYIPGAAPPDGDASAGAPAGVRATGVPPSWSELAPLDAGSNGWAVGRSRTEGGTGGLLVANPHFPWEGELRFAEVQLTVPGELDVYGAQLLGVPGVGIGFTDGVAWTHTVSSGKRMTAYRLTLDPASPTSYLVDGESRPMTPTTYSIDILRPDGTVDTEERTLWRSEYGPMVDFPGIGWTDTTAVTYRDANIDNDEFVEQYAALLHVRSLNDLIDLNAQYQGTALFNTIATGADGAVWYADTSATPNLSADAEAAFIQQVFTDPVTRAAWEHGVALLDGSNSLFAWEDVPGARDPGLVPFADMPQVVRDDYVFNANDSFWVPSAEFTLDGDFSVLQGTQGSPVSMRTRQNAAVLDDANTMGLAGDDGLFSGEELRDAVFDNTSHNALLLRDSVVAACRATPTIAVPEVDDDAGVVVLPAETVDLTAACEVLAGWDGRFDLDRRGAVLWRETMSRFTTFDQEHAGPLLAEPFDPARPTETPTGLAPDHTAVLTALARAVQTLTLAGFEVDTTLGAAQFTERSGNRIPLHGGTNSDGVTNVVTWSDDDTSTEPVPTRGDAVAPESTLRGEGYPVNYGTSFVLTVDFTGPEVRAWALLTYGQTGDRDAPDFEVQTVRFSDKAWRTVAFTDEQIEADPQLTTEHVTGA